MHQPRSGHARGDPPPAVGDQRRPGAAARLSGSFIVYEGSDFNAGARDHQQAGTYCSIYILPHSTTIDELVRVILANWPAEEMPQGDMFFTNNREVALHANDGILAMPVLWEKTLGRLVRGS